MVVLLVLANTVEGVKKKRGPKDPRIPKEMLANQKKPPVLPQDLLDKIRGSGTSPHALVIGTREEALAVLSEDEYETLMNHAEKRRAYGKRAHTAGRGGEIRA